MYRQYTVHTIMRRKRVTPQQQALVKAVIKNPHATLEELGGQAGYTSRQHVDRALKSHGVRALIASHPKLGRSKLLDKLAEGMDATTTKFFAHEGSVVEERECVDYPTRRNYLELAFRLHGDLAPAAEDLNQPGVQIINNVILAIEDAKKAGVIEAA